MATQWNAAPGDLPGDLPDDHPWVTGDNPASRFPRESRNRWSATLSMGLRRDAKPACCGYRITGLPGSDACPECEKDRQDFQQEYARDREDESLGEVACEECGRRELESLNGNCVSCCELADEQRRYRNGGEGI